MLKRILEGVVERMLKDRLIWIKVYFEVLVVIYFIGLIYILDECEYKYLKKMKKKK